MDLKELIRILHQVDDEAERIGLKDVQVWVKSDRPVPNGAPKDVALWPTRKAVHITIGRPEDPS